MNTGEVYIMSNEIFVYHVVTEKPMQVGQVIVFDEYHHNGVYDRIITCKQILDGEDVHNDLARLIRSDLSRWSATTYRELSLEKIRQEEFNNYPSRLACLYTSQQLHESEDWANFFIELGRDVYSIVKLKVNGRCFSGDACNVFDGTECMEENITSARHYWMNDIENDRPVIETLVDGHIEVVEIIKNFK